MNTYAFRTKSNSRFDVKASSFKSALNKVNSIPYLRDMVDGAYYKYDKEGLHCVDDGWEYFEVKK